MKVKINWLGVAFGLGFFSPWAICLIITFKEVIK